MERKRCVIFGKGQIGIKKNFPPTKKKKKKKRQEAAYLSAVVWSRRYFLHVNLTGDAGGGLTRMRKGVGS